MTTTGTGDIPGAEAGSSPATEPSAAPSGAASPEQTVPQQRSRLEPQTSAATSTDTDAQTTDAQDTDTEVAEPEVAEPEVAEPEVAEPEVAGAPGVNRGGRSKRHAGPGNRTPRALREPSIQGRRPAEAVEVVPLAEPVPADTATVPAGRRPLSSETPWQWWWRTVHGQARPTQTMGRNAWQEQVLTRCHLLRAGWAALQLPADAPGWQQQATLEFAALVRGAEEACTLRGLARFWPGVTGSAVERGWTRVHAAEAMLVAMLPPQQTSLVEARIRDQVRTYLPKNSAVALQLTRQRDTHDTGRRDRNGAGRPSVGHALGQLLGREDRSRAGRNGGGGSDVPPGALGVALLSARDASAAEHVRMRSYRNMLYLAALVLTLGTVALVALAGWIPQTLPTCAEPATAACVPDDVPDFGAVLVLAMVGAAAGIATGVLSLRRIRGTSVPYSVPAALWLLKAPAGAMSAVLGVLLLRSIPGLNELALTNFETVLGWAIVFGASQQLLTRLVDRRAQTLLRAVRSGSRKHLKRPHGRRRHPDGRGGRGGGGRHRRHRRR